MSKSIISLFLLCLITSFGFIAHAKPSNAGWVSGYYKSNGTYVNSYYRSSSNIKINNSYKSLTGSTKSFSAPSIKTYKTTQPSYTSPVRNYPSYQAGLKYQPSYYKPSSNTLVNGHFKTYSDGQAWNNRKSLYGF